MESYQGLAILTTNLRSSLDRAFQRRLRFTIHFPFPDATQRQLIWMRAFPPGTPTRDLAPEKLSQLKVSGGNIRNIALNAAFLAAEEGKAVSMEHLLHAAELEAHKIERPLAAAETRGWV
jgi:SpoVK/Ycf46/Vps4 family AAA+-type ATPase